MNRRYIIAVFLACGLLLSCDSFLQVDPQSELTQKAFPTTPQDALQSTNAVYSTLRNWHFHSGGYPILDIMSDDAHKGSSPDDAANTVGPYDDFSFATTADGLDRWWSALYQGIRRANIVIQEVPKIEMDKKRKKRFVGEARFLRGLYYFKLVRAFGGVPLVTSPEPALDISRSSTEKTYTFIEKDFGFAINNLPSKAEYSQNQLGRATNEAAQAFLAKVHLFQQEFGDAEDYALDVIKDSDYNYDLEEKFVDANGEAGEHGEESVFEIGAIATSGAGGNQYANTQGVRGTPNRGWGFNQPSIDLREAFEPGDPRKDHTIIELGEVIDGIKIIGDGNTPNEVTDDQGNVVRKESYNRKVWIEGTSTSTQFGHNRRLMRYADVLLMAAEALNENDKPNKALTYLNEVRERAREGNSSILPDRTTTDKESLRELIYHERRVELALEGHRFWDLVRTGRAPEVLGSKGYVEGKHNLLPIPQSEIDISQGSLTQNEAWQ